MSLLSLLCGKLKPYNYNPVQRRRATARSRRKMQKQSRKINRGGK